MLFALTLVTDPKFRDEALRQGPIYVSRNQRLSDTDHRQIYLCHAETPTRSHQSVARQFGVHRSTVSKILQRGRLDGNLAQAEIAYAQTWLAAVGGSLDPVPESRIHESMNSSSGSINVSEHEPETPDVPEGNEEVMAEQQEPKARVTAAEGNLSADVVEGSILDDVMLDAQDHGVRMNEGTISACDGIANTQMQPEDQSESETDNMSVDGSPDPHAANTPQRQSVKRRAEEVHEDEPQLKRRRGQPGDGDISTNGSPTTISQDQPEEALHDPDHIVFTFSFPLVATALNNPQQTEVDEGVLIDASSNTDIVNPQMQPSNGDMSSESHVGPHPLSHGMNTPQRLSTKRRAGEMHTDEPQLKRSRTQPLTMNKTGDNKASAMCVDSADDSQAKAQSGRGSSKSKQKKTRVGRKYQPALRRPQASCAETTAGYGPKYKPRDHTSRRRSDV
ncbi:hypothetical protein V5O48_003228 [Marasmius crinis-equi]|uniref:Uncharacterized protein n=1 Tax=Marasmius crinis-equi TaxID=585013 RepID=A0ABR3FTF4_9AGAR